MNKIKSFAIAAIVLVAAIVIAKIFINQGKPSKIEPVAQNASDKIVYEVRNKLFEKNISATGRMFAFDRFDIYAEVNGIILKADKPLRAGTYYTKGETIVKIDDSIYKNQLIAKRSVLLNQLSLLLPDLKYDFPNEYDKWLSYLDKFNVNETLPDLPQISSQREKYYLASKNVMQLFYDIKAMEATHEKYSIKAPFNGYLIASVLREGDMARAGQKLGSFTGAGLFEMQAAVPASDLKYLKKGMKAILHSYKSDKEIDARIARINPAISVESQSVSVFIQTKEKGVIDGAFYNVTIPVKTGIKAAKIPAEAFDAEKQITVQTDSGIKRIAPHIIDETPRYYYVTGLKDGTKIIYNRI